VTTSEKKVDSEKIDLVININKLDNFFINKIIVSGNTITKEATIRDRLKFSEGDLYNSNEVNKSIDNLKAVRFFSKVDLETKDDKSNKLKDIDIKVKEQPTGSISAGAGYGTQGGVIEGSINEGNFLGEGINLNFTGRLSTQQISGVFGYSTPNFLNSNRNANISLFSEKDEFKNTGFENKKIGTVNSTNYEIYEDVFFSPNFAIQHDSISAGGSSSALFRSRAGDYLTTSLGYGLTLDKRNSKFKTTEGFITSFDQNLATLLSDVPTLQTGAGITLFSELFNPEFIGSAKLRLDSGVGIADKDIKLSDRIFATSRDLRGFQNRGVGPVDGGDHVGGNYLATLSLKSTFPNPLPEIVRPTTFLFLDSGNVWGVDYSDRVNDSNKIRSSLGVGIDVVSPLGPLSFSFSNVISKAPTDKVQNFTFNIGSTF
ncbi:MAG: outer membrane protein assembly factor BamA, partial [Candidatus Fonsibacter sp.]